MTELNATHDPARRSFVARANDTGADFPLQNLPLGVFRRGAESRCGVAIGDQVLDLKAAQQAGLVTEPALSAPLLNPLLALGGAAASTLRARLFELLADGSPEQGRVAAMLVPAASVQMELPAAVGSFTDFFTSLHHTARAGRMTGREPPVPPAFRSLPIAYNSRASSVRVSGEAVNRPNGQRNSDGKANFGPSNFGPSTALDFELELGAFIGGGNPLGQPFHIDHAARQIAGYCLLNDWSSRDVQRWESDPLGPFLSKSFSTTISPWMVTEEALRPFRTPAPARAEGDPELLSYLRSERDQAQGGIALRMEALLLTPAMRAAGVAAATITRTDFQHMYWTFAQMATHHMSNGCNLRTGNLLGSGTVSGPTDDSRACLAELTVLGSEPLRLPGDERRAWLQDGDEVIFRARAERDGFVAIGFGECRGAIAPATPWPAG